MGEPADRNRGRRSMRYTGFDYSTPGAYFVTCCIQGSRHLLGRIDQGSFHPSPAGMIAQKLIDQRPAFQPMASIDCAVVMPNHVHLVILLNLHLGAYVAGAHPMPANLPEVLSAFKSLSARLINKELGQTGCAVWQRGHYDHIVRGEEDLQRIREYIANNPLAWHLDRENQARTGMNPFYAWIEAEKSSMV